MKIKDIYKEASLSLKGKFWRTFGVILLFIIATIVLVCIGLAFYNSELSILYAIYNIAFVIIYPALSFGLLNQIYNIAHDNNVSAFDFITLGFQNFKKVWCIIGRKLQKLLLPIIITVISVLIAAYCFVCCVIDVYGTSLSKIGTATPFSIDISLITNSSYFSVAIIFTIIAVASGIWTFIKSLRYIISEYILIENNTLTGKEIVEGSNKMMDGYKGKYFLMLLSLEAISLIITIIANLINTILGNNLIVLIIVLAVFCISIYLSIFAYYLRVAFYDLLKDELTLNSTSKEEQV